MGIFQRAIYGMCCDGCGKRYSLADAQVTYYFEDDLTFDAEEDGWKNIDGKWYCPKCFVKLFRYDEKLKKYVLIEKEE